MKSFWISLLFFILFMCACKTHELESNVAGKTAVSSDISTYHESVKQDTTRLTKLLQTENKWHLKLIQIIKEYDKDTGILTKETKTEGEVVQDTKKTTSQEEQRAVVEQNVDSVESSLVAESKLESETKEESIGGQESFGQWLGIILGIGIIIFLVFLWTKIKKYLHL